MNRICFIAIIFLCLIFTQSVGQSLSEELKRINDAYEETTKFSVDVAIHIYSNHLSVQPLETIKGNYKKEGENYVSVIDGQTTFQNSKYFISIDPVEKYILVGNPVKSPNMLYQGINIDSILKYCSSSKAISLKGNQKKITLSFENDLMEGVASLEVYYNASSFFMEKLILFYNTEVNVSEDEKPVFQKPRMEIRYQNMNLAPVFPADLFSEKKFLTINSKTIEPSQNYRDFQIIDQRLKR